MEEILQGFAAALRQVVALGERIAAQETATTEKEAETLAALIEVVKPALAYIHGSVETAVSFSGYRGHEEKRKYHLVKGVILVDNFRQIPTDRDYRGDYVGTQLILTAFGKLMELERHGSWSTLEGEPSSWEAYDTTLTPTQTVERYDFAEIVRGLVGAFKDTLAASEEKAERLERRLELLEQVKTVITRGDTG